jgi:hypothetical protein
MIDKPEARRFPPPWSVEETDACFVVLDGAQGMESRKHFLNARHAGVYHLRGREAKSSSCTLS